MYALLSSLLQFFVASQNKNTVYMVHVRVHSKVPKCKDIYTTSVTSKCSNQIEHCFIIQSTSLLHQFYSLCFLFSRQLHPHKHHSDEDVKHMNISRLPHASAVFIPPSSQISFPYFELPISGIIQYVILLFYVILCP